MQEKISDICLRFRSEYPSLGHPPMGGNSASLVTAQWAGHLGTDIPIRTAKYDRYYYSGFSRIESKSIKWPPVI
jgi:hypothetical protein